MERITRSSRARRREAGIALMVVMVVFIILYLVVFQLHYTTKLEERLSRARSADAQGSAAVRSVTYYILELLAEDYQKSQQSSSGTGSTTASTTGASSMSRMGEFTGDARLGNDSSKKKAEPASSAGTDPTAPGASASGGPTWYDYIHKDLFLPNEKTLNGTTVRIRIVDDEGRFDLNQLWVYPPSLAETLTEVNKEKDDEAARKAASDPILANALNQTDPTGKAAAALKNQKSTQKKTAGASGTSEEQQAAVEFVLPTDDKRAETVKMLTRAIDMCYKLNVENGFDYKVMPPLPQVLAEAIERYAFERRSQPYQNYIHLTSELLNVLAMLGASPEVYYGPEPSIPQGEEFFDRNQEFRYTRDEYGDLTGEYIYAEDMSDEREQMKSQLSELQSMYGQYQDFSSLGFGRMGNPMTKDMKDYAEYEDDKGNVTLKVPPMPIGLKDLLCTFSTGKININTAPVPVLYALLSLIIETEPDGELRAQGIALNIQSYRDYYQSEYDETDPIQAEEKTNSAGAPHRQPSSDGSASPGGPKTGSGSKNLPGSSSASSLAGLSPEDLAAAANSGGSSDYQTNYFTNLSQLKLIDGEDGGRDDYLTDKTASTAVELENKSPLDKVIHDYQQVMVFGSTYFTATLKSKTKESSSIKTGYLTVLRDIGKKQMEVIQWKELQR